MGTEYSKTFYFLIDKSHPVEMTPERLANPAFLPFHVIAWADHNLHIGDFIQHYPKAQMEVVSKELTVPFALNTKLYLLHATKHITYGYFKGLRPDGLMEMYFPEMGSYGAWKVTDFTTDRKEANKIKREHAKALRGY